MPTKLLSELNELLEQFSWRANPWEAAEKTGAILLRTQLTLNDVVGFFQVSTEQLDVLAHQSYETPTHFKWFLHRSRVQGYEIWAHQFKEKKSTTGVFADSIHNHRYHFSSKVVRGGYQQILYHFTGHHHASTFETRNLHVASITDFKQGEVNILDHRTYHSLVDVVPQTVTLYVRTPALVEESTGLFPGKDGHGEIRHFPPLTVHLRHWLAIEQQRPT